MKQLFFFISTFIYISTNAQLIIDDFSTGELKAQSFTKKDNGKLYQQGNNIVKKSRMLIPIAGANPYNQAMQLTIKNGEMVISYPYGTRGSTLQVGYGYTPIGTKPMNLDTSKYKRLRIAFAAKSTINGLNITFFGTEGRAAYSNHIPAREGPFVFDVLLKDLKYVYKKFTLSDIDHLFFQFDSRSKTGCNMAIDKIWFE